MVCGAQVVADQTPEIHPAVQQLVSTYCFDCHSKDDPAGNFNLEMLATQQIGVSQPGWEKVVKKLSTGQMPPAGMVQPAQAETQTALTKLVSSLDHYSETHPQPGRTQTFRRLTRFEYQNVIRDLLDLEIDAAALLPSDEISHGFDNVTTGELSPSHLNRYVSAAQKISRLAIGWVGKTPDVRTVRVRPDITQDHHLDGLPLGTRGGVAFRHNFPRSGEYEISVRLSRDRNEHIEGLSEPHELEILCDLERVAKFEVKPPSRKSQGDGYSQVSHANLDQHLKQRLHMKAGAHEIAATFIAKDHSLLETRRQPLNVHYNMYRHPRLGPAVYQVSIVGPFNPETPSPTPSRNRIFGSPSQQTDDTTQRAEEIIERLLRRAIRRPVKSEDLVKPMSLFHEVANKNGFEAGIEVALASILVHPEFLFRIEAEPNGIKPGVPYQISDIELASRLSFFLWSSIPDDELLSLAESNQLHDSEILSQQTKRMLADERSQTLVQNFSSQWLYLRNLDATVPDARLFPDFGDNLRQAFREETELFLESVFRDDRSVLTLLRSDYTFLNERLAKHYGIPHIYGSRFRRVSLDPQSHRGGLLRQGSILTVTSYANRTSPVIRGKWILENILGTPPPPPPPNIPDLEDNTVSALLPVRERLAQHRAAEACASCHDLIDPIGFALENFDAVGSWRELELGEPVNATGELPGGHQFDGVEGLEQGLLSRPEVFVSTLTEKLMTYALGRGLQYYDASAVRKIVHHARETDFRFSSIVLGIVHSRPFLMRMSQ